MVLVVKRFKLTGDPERNITESNKSRDVGGWQEDAGVLIPPVSACYLTVLLNRRRFSQSDREILYQCDVESVLSVELYVGTCVAFQGVSVHHRLEARGRNVLSLTHQPRARCISRTVDLCRNGNQLRDQLP